jgi:hypothetical protein
MAEREADKMRELTESAVCVVFLDQLAL